MKISLVGKSYKAYLSVPILRPRKMHVINFGSSLVVCSSKVDATKSETET